jgi:hypothetical protein
VPVRIRPGHCFGLGRIPYRAVGRPSTRIQAQLFRLSMNGIKYEARSAWGDVRSGLDTVEKMRDKVIMLINLIFSSMRSLMRHVKIDCPGLPQSSGLGHSFHLLGSVDALAVEPMETLAFRELRGPGGQPRPLPCPSKPWRGWKWRWVVAGIVAWLLSVCLAIVAGLWLLFVLNPPGTFHEYRGVPQALFLRLWHEDKITFYGPIEISARWGNQPYWHQMTVQDLTMTIDQFRKGIDKVKPVGSASHNLETDDAIDDRHNQGPKVHLTPHQ